MDIYKAQETTPDTPIPNLYIVATDPLPDIPYQESEQFFADQACEIAARLHASLPGGTLHALLIEMLQRRTNLLRVGER